MWINVESTSRDIGVDGNWDSSSSSGGSDGSSCESSCFPLENNCTTLEGGVDYFGWNESFRLVVDLLLWVEDNY